MKPAEAEINALYLNVRLECSIAWTIARDFESRQDMVRCASMQKVAIELGNQATIIGSLIKDPLSVDPQFQNTRKPKFFDFDRPWLPSVRARRAEEVGTFCRQQRIEYGHGSGRFNIWGAVFLYILIIFIICGIAFVEVIAGRF